MFVLDTSQLTVSCHPPPPHAVRCYLTCMRSFRVLHDWGVCPPDCYGVGSRQGAFGQEQQLFTVPEGQLLLKVGAANMSCQRKPRNRAARIRPSFRMEASSLVHASLNRPGFTFSSTCARLNGVFSPISLAWQANKHFHIYAGWFAYISGLVQCYRGLELVAGSDALVFSAAEMSFSVSYLYIRRFSVCACVRVQQSKRTAT